jgi:CelD/BcsL family acetyltransferase involved in cellulose biosynthesis
MSVNTEQFKQGGADTLARVASLETDAEKLPLRTPTRERVSEHQAFTKAREMSVVVVRDLEELSRRVGDWEELAAASLEPNAFYEPWMLLPAARAFGEDSELLLALVYAPHPRVESAPPVLYGLFPLERRRRYKGLPVKTLRLWQHLHCFLCTPLVRAERARECVAAFFDWLAESGEALMEFNFVAGDGPFHQLLVEEFNARGTLFHPADYFTRALYRPAADAETYLRDARSGRRRKELRRQERRLAERGAVEYVELEPDGDACVWADEFLRLEATGWKGRGGTAMTVSTIERAYFVESAREAHRRGRLMMLGLRVGGRFVALKCNYLAGAGSFAFKIAFDESFASYSPGVLLEVENIRRLHARSGIEWMDSCSAPVNFINSLWPERRTICTLVAATGKSYGGLVVSLLPLLRWLNRRLSFSRSTSRAASNKSARSAVDDNATQKGGAHD